VHGRPLLLAIGLSTPFTFVTFIFIVFTWLDQRVWLLLTITACSAVTLITLSFLLIPHLGVAGVGWAFLIAQAGAALLMAPRAWIRVRMVLRSPTSIPIATTAPARRSAPQLHWPSASAPSRRTNATAWAGLAVAIFAPLLILGAPRSDVSLVAVLALAGAGFGPAVTCRLDTGDPAAQIALTVVLSLAAFALGASVMIWLAWWHPAVLLVLAAPSAASCVHRILTLPRLPLAAQ